MQKIITLFRRNSDGDRLVRDELTPGAEWVKDGEGMATRKYDGTACLFHGDILWKRYDVKAVKITPGMPVKAVKVTPALFLPAEDSPDPQTGHWPGWLPVGKGPEDRWRREAFALGHDADGFSFHEGQTYELCGPKVQGNPEEFRGHVLVRHSAVILANFPRTYGAIRDALAQAPHIEGVVWHHADGRMVKIKMRDFGLKRQPCATAENPFFALGA